MARKRIRDIRNEEFIEATIVTVHKRGYASVTMAEIAREAGSSAASISYYFGSKEGLMEATMRHLLRKLRTAMVAGYDRAQTPKERLYAVMDANFADSLFSVPQCNIWMQFWANAPYSTTLARLHRINRARVRSHFLAELGQLLPAAQVETARQALQSYMDGVWLQAAQSEGPLNAEAARRAAHQVVDLVTSSGIEP
ncbi:transcriptional regulator BetI [Phaeobacter sp. HF9A]|uniref:choline-binding transcriptional repressor BetI n=1 Tax=Phaeobacter sp. HF9A TaxID=2721561 RepID=UPI001430B1E3|nr:transcriptional regulator BetI [Phaeobacter sp. HF9A]NIZ15031.1 transcriptional regulator BetI [Phaeobacter sp. HF9A]